MSDLVFGRGCRYNACGKLNCGKLTYNKYALCDIHINSDYPRNHDCLLEALCSDNDIEKVISYLHEPYITGTQINNAINFILSEVCDPDFVVGNRDDILLVLVNCPKYHPIVFNYDFLFVPKPISRFKLINKYYPNYKERVIDFDARDKLRYIILYKRFVIRLVFEELDKEHIGIIDLLPQILDPHSR